MEYVVQFKIEFKSPERRKVQEEEESKYKF